MKEQLQIGTKDGRHISEGNQLQIHHGQEIKIPDYSGETCHAWP